MRAVLLLLLATIAAPRPGRAAITPANVGTLALRWDFPLPVAVTGALVVANGLVYVPSWDGRIYALDPETGAQRWNYNLGGFIPGGVITTPGGNLCFGNAFAQVACINGTTGQGVWKRNIGAPGLDAVWAQLAVANGRLLVGIASLQDVPCTHGRLLALDLATGNELWTLKTVPDRVCSTDTAIACTDDTPCGGGTCVEGRGAGVTATPVFDPTGDFAYMNTVGCYTFPSIGDSDSVFKVNAATGAVVWKNRVTPPEQFGFCANDSGVDCSTNAQCASVGGTCTIPKGAYHDFGFLNGPLLVDVPAAGGGTETLVVSGSKDGTLYAFHEDDGTIAWTNEVQPIPVSPGFAGFGLFNGALAYANGRLHAALNQLIPARVCDNDHRKACTSDAACGAGHCLPLPPHLIAFDPDTGQALWTDDIGPSWSSVAVVNGVLYAGTQVKDDTTGESDFFAYDAAAGTRLATFRLPASSTSRAVVTGDTLLVGYGVFSDGGVRAYGFCGNGRLDAGEECDPGTPGTGGCCTHDCELAPEETVCDDGNPCTGGDTCTDGHCTATVTPGAPCPADDGNPCTDAVCNETAACVQRPNTSACDDGDACTTGDRCAAGQCAGSVGTTAAVGCVIDRIDDRPCGDTPLPPALAQAVGRRLTAAHHLLDRAAAQALKGRTAKVEKTRRAASTRLAGIADLTAKAVRSRQQRRQITAACKASIDALVERGQVVLSGLAF